MEAVAQLRANLVTIKEMCDGNFTSSTSMSGTDMIYNTTNTLFQVFLQHFGIPLENIPEWSCECEEYKAPFIRKHHDVVIFPDVTTLSSGIHKDVDGNHRAVTRTIFHAGGVECDSVSAANNQRAMHENCVKKGTGRNGSSWTGFKHIVVTLKPAWWLMENVKGIVKPEHLHHIIRVMNEAFTDVHMTMSHPTVPPLTPIHHPHIITGSKIFSHRLGTSSCTG